MKGKGDDCWRCRDGAWISKEQPTQRRKDGQAFVIAVYDDVQAACDALPAARALWGRFADMVEGEPTARFLEVLATKGLAAQDDLAGSTNDQPTPRRSRHPRL